MCIRLSVSRGLPIDYLFIDSHGNNLLDSFIFLDMRSQNGIEDRIQGQGKINLNNPIKRSTVLALLLPLEKSQGVSVNPSFSFSRITSVPSRSGIFILDNFSPGITPAVKAFTQPAPRTAVWDFFRYHKL